MIKDLIKVANSLDSKGFSAEADLLDLLIQKIAQMDGPYKIDSKLQRDLAVFTKMAEAPSGHLALFAAYTGAVPKDYASVANLGRFITTKEEFATFLKAMLKTAEYIEKTTKDQVEPIVEAINSKWMVGFDFDRLKARLNGTDKTSFFPGAFMDDLRKMMDDYRPYYDEDLVLPTTEPNLMKEPVIDEELE